MNPLGGWSRYRMRKTKHDQIHLANEAWGYGHAETRAPSLHYNSVNVTESEALPIPPQIKSAECFEHDIPSPSIVVVALP